MGLGGLDGQGQRELLLALFGVLRGVSGETRVNGERRRIGSPAEAKRDDVGMALIPEDRKTEGLMLPMSVRDNISIAALGSMTRGLVVDRAREAARIEEIAAKLKIKFGDLGDAVATLSGGNQQKVVIAKWLLTGARIVLLNDPTRGIDVGTKQEIYQLLRDLADAGTAILFYSTDYDELIGCCDRVLILYDGRIVRELEGADITEAQYRGEFAEFVAGRGGGPGVNNLRLRFSQNTGLWLGVALFVVLYTFYSSLHPKGWSVDLLVQNSNESFALIMVSMAQTVPVITGGIDLSVGPMMTLVNCLASVLISGSPVEIVLGIVACLAAGALAGFVNGCIVVFGRIQPIIVDAGDRRDLYRPVAVPAPLAGRQGGRQPVLGRHQRAGRDGHHLSLVPERRARLVQPRARPSAGADRADRAGRAAGVGAVPQHRHRPRLLRRRLGGRGGLHVGPAHRAQQDRRVHARRAVRGVRRPAISRCRPAAATPTSRRPAPTRSTRSPRWWWAAPRCSAATAARSGRSSARWCCARSPSASASFDSNGPFGFLGNPLLQPIFEGVILLLAVSLGAARVFRVKNRLSLFT